ncbi:hypothetical protein ACFYKX_04130 [Cytobacillus sp. FJAT-54145]|uniref:Uncharacterized protein n=1 Tax=Cytobacillus spartinae TaxID=3299023 RepID=A0ABW6K6J8_9BACI
MSPEESKLDAEIDERSNVFLMGASAFQLFGGGIERTIDKWQGNEKMYSVALKAVNIEKEDRYQTIDEYIESWNNATGSFSKINRI